MGWFTTLTWSVCHCLARPSAGRWAKILEPLQLFFFGRLALSAICLLIEGNSKNLSLFVSWKGSIWGKISCSVIVHLLESFRMSLAGESVSNHCWLDRMMYATTALITSVTSRSCRFSKLLSEMSKRKAWRPFVHLSLLLYFGRTRRFM